MIKECIRYRLQSISKQAGVELGLTQAETVSLELGLIKGWSRKYNLVPKEINPQNFGPKNCWSQQKILSQKVFVPKKFGSKYVGLKKIKIQPKPSLPKPNQNSSWKNCWSKNIFGDKKNFGRKTYSVQKKFGPFLVETFF